VTRLEATLALAFLVGTPLGCVEPPEILAHEDLVVVSINPPDGSAAVPVDVAPKVVFSIDIPREVPIEVVLHRGAIATELTCGPSGDPTVLDCPLLEDLRPDAWYRISVDIHVDGELDAESIWTTGDPNGLTFDVGPDLAVEQLGGNESAVTLLEDLLLSGDDHLVLVLDRFSPGHHSLPWEGNYLLGNAQVRENKKTGELEADIDDDSGLTISTHGTLQSDGHFTAEADYAALPVSVDGDDIQLLLEDVWLTGHIPISEHEYERVQDVHLSAAVSKEALDELAQAVPEWAQVIADVTGLIDLDVDLDGDGIDDAASFAISSSGERVALAE